MPISLRAFFGRHNNVDATRADHCAADRILGGALCALTVLLSACQHQAANSTWAEHSQVHLFAADVSTANVARLAEALKAAGFTPVVRDLALPQTVWAPTIVHAAGHPRPNEIDTVAAVSAAAGYPIREVALRQHDNHHFSGAHIGLYVVPDDYQPPKATPGQQRLQALAQEYVGECTTHDAALALNASGTAQLVVYQWTDGRELEVVQSGSWQVLAAGIELNLDTTSVTFQSEPYLRATRGGELTGLRLRPVSDASAIDDCAFIYAALQY